MEGGGAHEEEVGDGPAEAGDGPADGVGEGDGVAEVGGGLHCMRLFREEVAMGGVEY